MDMVKFLIILFFIHPLNAIAVDNGLELKKVKFLNGFWNRTNRTYFLEPIDFTIKKGSNKNVQLSFFDAEGSVEIVHNISIFFQNKNKVLIYLKNNKEDVIVLSKVKNQKWEQKGKLLSNGKTSFYLNIE